jgi:uncharacterized protein (DUF433 family)
MKKREIKYKKPRIVRDPKIMMGKPCVKGTRLTIELILERLAYHPFDELLESYPELTLEDVKAALLYAARYIRTRYSRTLLGDL